MAAGHGALSAYSCAPSLPRGSMRPFLCHAGVRCVRDRRIGPLPAACPPCSRNRDGRQSVSLENVGGKNLTCKILHSPHPRQAGLRFPVQREGAYGQDPSLLPRDDRFADPPVYTNTDIAVNVDFFNKSTPAAFSFWRICTFQTVQQRCGAIWAQFHRTPC